MKMVVIMMMKMMIIRSNLFSVLLLAKSNQSILSTRIRERKHYAQRQTAKGWPAASNSAAFASAAAAASNKLVHRQQRHGRRKSRLHALEGTGTMLAYSNETTCAIGCSFVSLQSGLGSPVCLCERPVSLYDDAAAAAAAVRLAVPAWRFGRQWRASD